MNFSNLNLFSERGGEFLIPLSDFIDKAQKIKAIVFDWDGVYNSGVKGDNVYSYFSEVDSMGLNMLRYAYKLSSNNILIAGIISGELNPTTEKFVNREHLNFKCLGFKDKKEGLKRVLDKYGLQPSEIAFVFDDVLDLGVAEQVGLRFQVKHKSALMFNKLVKEKSLADYITFSDGSEFAVREISELIISALGIYDQTITSRYKFDESYAKYISERNSIQPITWDAKISY